MQPRHATYQSLVQLFAFLAAAFMLLAPNLATEECTPAAPLALQDEFCGSPPPQSISLVASSCCHSEECGCGSRICGGPDVTMRESKTAPAPNADRLTVPLAQIPEPPIRSYRPLTRLRTLQGVCLEPPTPPPPRLLS